MTCSRNDKSNMHFIVQSLCSCSQTTLGLGLGLGLGLTLTLTPNPNHSNYVIFKFVKITKFKIHQI